MECKASSAPAVSKGFWTALRDLDVAEAFIAAPVREGYPAGKGVRVAPLGVLLDELRRRSGG